MAGAVEELGASKVLAGLQRLDERVVRRVAGRDEELRQPDAHVLLELRDAECSRLRGRGRVFRDRAARRLPLGESAVENSKPSAGKPW